MSYIGITPLVGNRTAATVLNALNSAVAIDMNGNNTVGMKVTTVSSPSGISVVVDTSYDGGSTWQSQQGYFTTIDGTISNSLAVTTANVAYSLIVGGGVTNVRVRISAFTSGSITVALTTTNVTNGTNLFATTRNSTTAAPQNIQIGGWDGSNSRTISTNASGHVNIADGGNAITVDGTVSLGAGSNAIGKLAANDGVDIGDVTINNAIGSAVYSRLTDGTNTAAVKAASTAAVAADPALVVSVSPNTAIKLDTGTNSIGTVGLNSGSNTIGKVDLNAGTNSLGTVGLNTGTNSIGTVGLNSGSNTIGKVDLNAGTNTIGKVDLNAGTNTIGKVNIVEVYAEDAVSTGGESLFLSGAVRQDTIAANTSANGDYTYLKTNNVGRLYVTSTLDAAIPAGTNTIGKVDLNAGTNTIGKVDLNAGSNTIGKVDLNAGTNTIGKVNILEVYAEDAGSVGGETLFLAGAVRQDTISTTTSDNGDYTNLKTNDVGRLYVTATVDAAIPAGTNTIGKVDLNAGSNTIGKVDLNAGSNTIGKVDLNAGTNTIGKVNIVEVYAEDAGSVGGESLFLAGAVRQDTLAATTSATGDYTFLKTNNVGRLYVTATVDAALPAGTNAIGKLSANSGVIIGAVELTGATTNTLTNATTTAYASALQIKASAGVLYMVTGYNSKTSAQFIQIHDLASAPAEGVAPKITFIVPPQQNFSFDLGTFGRAFAAGIYICNSSTGPTKTLGSADCWFDAQYK